MDGLKEASPTSDHDIAKLLMDGEEFELSSFVLSGEDKNGRRVLFTYQVSLDETITYTKVLEVLVTEKIRANLNDDM